MKKHLFANLVLFTVMLGIVCIVYPTVIWLYANCLFPDTAVGSLVVRENAGETKIVQGSHLIAQPFTKDWYFQPRPSAVSYNATASGASNFGASNPCLRDRVARQLGPIVKYDQHGAKKDNSVQTDIENWFAGYVPHLEMNEPPLVVQWAKNYPTLAANWMKDDANRPALVEWLRHRREIMDEWQKSHPDATVVDLNDAKPTIPFGDIAVSFFESVASTKEFANRWLESESFETDAKDAAGKPVAGKRFKPVDKGADLQATFFDMWLQAHPDVALQRVPADMVTTSGSGLDPHITLRNAEYQMTRVLAARASAVNLAPAAVQPRMQAILKDYAFVPLTGLVGEPLVNVLEVNLELDRQLPIPPSPSPAKP